MSLIILGVRNGFGDIDGSHLYTPYSFVYVNEVGITISFIKFNISCSLPWNQSTILGWLGETIYSLIVCVSFLTLNYGVLSLFMAIGEFHQSFQLHFQQILTAEDARLRHLKTKIRDSIRFHNLSSGLSSLKNNFFICQILNNFVFFQFI